MKKEIDISSIKGITLLSKEEYNKYSDKIPPIRESWWLRSAGGHVSDAACVFGEYGNALVYGLTVDSEFGVRPALQISNPEFLQPGDNFNFGEQTFTYLGDNLALSDNIVGKCVFREDWTASDANIYEKSDVKKYVEDWFKKEISKTADEHKIEFDVTISIDPVVLLNSSTGVDIKTKVIENLSFSDYYDDFIRDELAFYPPIVTTVFEETGTKELFDTGVLTIKEKGAYFDSSETFEDIREGTSLISYGVPCEFDIDKFIEVFVEKNRETDEPDR